MRFAIPVLLSIIGGAALACEPIPTPDPVLGTVGVEVWYGDPTTEYGHGVLGDAIEAKRIFLRSPRSDCGVFITDAGEGHVFEDTVPRLFDVDGDGVNEVIAVRSSFTQGAQLVVYHEGQGSTLEIMASTDYIGQRNRWLAVVGAADLDGDGVIEIAYVDRPHLAKTLRVVSVDGDKLVQETAAAGVTNHRIGERDIAGGIRDCGSGPEMIVANANWSALLSVTLQDGTLSGQQIGEDTSRTAFAAAMACKARI